MKPETRNSFRFTPRASYLLTMRQKAAFHIGDDPSSPLVSAIVQTFIQNPSGGKRTPKQVIDCYVKLARDARQQLIEQLTRSDGQRLLP